MFKNKDGKPTGPQAVAVTWGKQKEVEEALLHSSLFDVAAQFTLRCHPNATEPEELVSTFKKTYGLLQDWFYKGPLREELEGMLNTLYPDPIGYKPGETLMARPPKVPREAYEVPEGGAVTEEVI